MIRNGSAAMSGDPLPTAYLQDEDCTTKQLDQVSILRPRRHRFQLSPDFPTREVHGVDVQIGRSVLDARDQRGLGQRDRPALQGDKGGIGAARSPGTGAYALVWGCFVITTSWSA